MFAPLQAFWMSDGQILTWRRNGNSALPLQNPPWDWRGKESRKCLLISKISGDWKNIYLMRRCVVCLSRKKLHILLPDVFWDGLGRRKIEENTYRTLLNTTLKQPWRRVCPPWLFRQIKSLLLNSYRMHPAPFWGIYLLGSTVFASTCTRQGRGCNCKCDFVALRGLEWNCRHYQLPRRV